jgi:hypothetical protein
LFHQELTNRLTHLSGLTAQLTNSFMKLREIILLAAAAGFLVIWIAEYQRTTFGDSYWLLMLFLGFLLAFQYVRSKRIEQKKSVSPTVKQMVEKKKKKK